MVQGQTPLLEKRTAFHWQDGSEYYFPDVLVQMGGRYAKQANLDKVDFEYMTDQKPELTQEQREVYLARWAALVAELRYLAKLLGFPNPFPTRKERREGRRIDQSNP